MLRTLSVPDGLCLRELSESERWTWGARYLVIDRTLAYWPDVPLTEAQIVQDIAFQTCFAHQHRVVMDAGLVFDYQYAWEKTPEGLDYIKATGWSLKDGVWYKGGVAQEYLRPSGQAAQACATWYLTGRAYASELSWVKRWLPK